MRLAFPGMPAQLLCGALLALCLAGCASPPLQTARDNFYAGRFEQANTNLAVIPQNDKDEILYLMERGTIRQNLGQYQASAQDWRRAGDLDAGLETYSISHGVSSLIVNDCVLSFRGMPFERTLMYAFLANDYLADSNWDYAAICARNIIKKLESLDGFPDIAYGRYLAGFCLELTGDPGNAAIQYRAAAALLTNSVVIDGLSGNIRPAVAPADPAPPVAHDAPPAAPAELVCFVFMGRAPAGVVHGDHDGQAAPYAEIYCGDKCLGRSYAFANTAALMGASQRRLAARQLAKDATRLATKIAIYEALDQQNDLLGALALLALFAMESPDTRSWQTLPRWLEVARVPCPADLKNYTVVYKSAGGDTLGSQIIAAPITRRGQTFISFCRDLGR